MREGRRQEAGAAHLELVAKLGDQLAHEGHRRCLAAEVQLVAAEAEQRARPGPAALLVAHHLHLVDDAYADCRAEKKQLDAPCKCTILCNRVMYDYCIYCTVHRKSGYNHILYLVLKTVRVHRVRLKGNR